jgi:hypothetical protein
MTVHAAIVLRFSCVPEEVGVSQKGVNQELFCDNNNGMGRG